MVSGDAWPDHSEGPAPAEFTKLNDMHNLVINRHEGSVNVIFCDGSASKVGLKGMWRLKWHKDFQTGNNQTMPGAVAQIQMAANMLAATIPYQKAVTLKIC